MICSVRPKRPRVASGLPEVNFYAKAIAEFLKQQDGSAITERLNEVYDRQRAKADSGLHRAQLKSLEKDAW